MARESVSWPDLVRILGDDAARDMCLSFGGLPVYVGKRPSEKLLAAIGETAALELCRHYGGSEIIPAMGPKKKQTVKDQAVTLLASGISQLDVAIMLGCHIRTVQMVGEMMSCKTRRKRIDTKNIGVAPLPM